mgnify:CR=1 FL=1
MYMQYSILAVLLLGSVLAQMMPYIRKVKEGKVIVHVMAFLFVFGGLELQKEGLKYYRMIKPAVEKEASA